MDQYLNIKLTEVAVVDGERFPQLQAMTTCFIRGSVSTNTLRLSNGGNHFFHARRRRAGVAHLPGGMFRPP